ncbi:MAG TPA: periplasmic heavy metal sensor [Candidatus Polarisedimenticolaceae bacterium]|nr:periplasmic heavy metal sensor [Candidatus Polarisedimenticolaceae bacterium]
MKIYVSSGLLLTFILIAGPSKLLAADEPSFLSEDRTLTPESIGRRLRELLDRLKENFTFEVSGEERAPISLMLRNRERLGLTADQVKYLEQLRNDFAKESIRSEANLRIAELDLTSLLEAQPVDMGRVEAKIRDIERIRADLRIARVRSIEKGKAQLSAEQRRKLQELQAQENFTGIRFKNEPSTWLKESR